MRRRTGPAHPPSRLLTVAGVAAVALAFVGVVQAVDLLRHPMPDDLPAASERDDAAADPRVEVVCEDPEPRAIVTSSDLLACPREHHEVVVRFRGEVVGGVLPRRDGAWVQLNDDVYAETRGPLPAHRDYRGGNAGLGVFIPLGLAEQIEAVGGPQLRGDVLEVVGEFRRIDHERQEAAVIIADEGSVAVRGRPVRDPLLPQRRGIALGLSVLALSVAVAERLVARRRRS